MRVVDDFARQIHRTAREALARLVGVIDRAIDAVTEAEFPGEVDREPARAVGELVRLDAIDDRAVIVLGQHACDGIFQVEAFAEDERRHEMGLADLPAAFAVPHMRRERVEGLQRSGMRPLERHFEIRQKRIVDHVGSRRKAGFHGGDAAAGAGGVQLIDARATACLQRAPF